MPGTTDDRRGRKSPEEMLQTRDSAIYLDSQFTTPVDPRVASAVLHAMTEAFGNANSSEHAFGMQAEQMVSQARSEVAKLVGAGDQDAWARRRAPGLPYWLPSVGAPMESPGNAPSHRAWWRRRGARVFDRGLGRVQHHRRHDRTWTLSD